MVLRRFPDGLQVLHELVVRAEGSDGHAHPLNQVGQNVEDAQLEKERKREKGVLKWMPDPAAKEMGGRVKDRFTPLATRVGQTPSFLICFSVRDGYVEKTRDCFLIV